MAIFLAWPREIRCYVYDWKAAQKGEPSEPVTSFEFPRQRSMRRLCIADFFLPKEKAKPGEYDVFPMQAVTMGNIATEFAGKLFAADDYTNYLYYHGLAVQMAEALAEWAHQRIRSRAGLWRAGAGRDSEYFGAALSGISL